MVLSSLEFPTHVGSSLPAFPRTLPPYLGAVLFEIFLYGLYTILFSICLYVLSRGAKNGKRLHWTLLVSASVMFCIASADIGYTLYLLFEKFLQKGQLGFNDLRPKYWLYVTNNVIADFLLMYRCYIVWEFRKSVIVCPIILLIAATVCGYIFEGSSSELFDNAFIYLIMTLILNVLLTALTAGRIWWLARKARSVLVTGLLQRYNATIAILIESGLVYSLYIIFNLALSKATTANIILDAGLIQVVGIMPTLIIVQVGLGRAVHDIEANDAIIDIVRIESNWNNFKSTADNNRSYPGNIGSRHGRSISSVRSGDLADGEDNEQNMTDIEHHHLERPQHHPHYASSATFVDELDIRVFDELSDVDISDGATGNEDGLGIVFGERNAVQHRDNDNHTISESIRRHARLLSLDLSFIMTRPDSRCTMNGMGPC